MSTTPAAVLARLKVTYQGWGIRRAAEGTGFTAQRRDERCGQRLRSIYAPSMVEPQVAVLAITQDDTIARTNGVRVRFRYQRQALRLLRGSCLGRYQTDRQPGACMTVT